MIRRLDIDLLRSVRLISKKSTKKLLLGGSFTAMALLYGPNSHCAGKKNDDASTASYFGFFSNATVKPSDSEKDDGEGKGNDRDIVADLLTEYSPTLQKLGFGGIMGICTGIALKRIGTGAASLVGMGFIILQSLNYMGYITIDYKRIQHDTIRIIDVNNDGQFTIADMKIIWEKCKDILTFNLPGASGFSAGFAMGIYFGK